MPDCAGTSFTNVIYTKLSTLTSRKIPQLRAEGCEIIFFGYFSVRVRVKVINNEVTDKINGEKGIQLLNPQVGYRWFF